jgi:hypothetical protein
MIELASAAFETTLESERKKPKHQRTAGVAENLFMLQRFIKAVTFPSAFLLRTDSGHQVAGTIKEEGMEEPISSYYFKHGPAGLAGVYLVGIKEVAAGWFSLPETQLFGAGQFAAKAFSEMVFPPDAIRITPIALFRKL